MVISMGVLHSRVVKQTAKDYGAPMQVLQKQASSATTSVRYMNSMVPQFMAGWTGHPCPAHCRRTDAPVSACNCN